jgi:signal transduction histidine kinase
MSKEFQKNMFRPFEQEHSDARGAGLGLSIAQQIVTKMQGTITVKSELNKGTEFVVQVTLPVAARYKQRQLITVLLILAVVLYWCAMITP